MAGAYVNSTYVTSTNSATITATTAGNALVACFVGTGDSVTANQVKISSVTGGGTWTRAIQQLDTTSGGSNIEIWFNLTVATGTTSISWTTSTSTVASATILEYSGLAGFDASNGTSGAYTVLPSLSFTTKSVNTMAIACVGQSASLNSWGVGSAWTKRGGTTTIGAVEDQNFPSAGTKTANWTNDPASGRWGLAVVSFATSPNSYIVQSKVANGASNQSSVTMNFTNATTAGNTLMLWTTAISSPPSVSDNKNGTWNKLTGLPNFTNGSMAIWYMESSLSLASTDNITVGASGAAYAYTYFLLELTGIAQGAAWDVWSSADVADTGTNTSVTSSGSYGPFSTGDAVISMYVNNSYNNSVYSVSGHGLTWSNIIRNTSGTGKGAAISTTTWDTTGPFATWHDTAGPSGKIMFTLGLRTDYANTCPLMSTPQTFDSGSTATSSWSFSMPNVSSAVGGMLFIAIQTNKTTDDSANMTCTVTPPGGTATAATLGGHYVSTGSVSSNNILLYWFPTIVSGTWTGGTYNINISDTTTFFATAVVANYSNVHKSSPIVQSWNGYNTAGVYSETVSTSTPSSNYDLVLVVESEFGNVGPSSLTLTPRPYQERPPWWFPIGAANYTVNIGNQNFITSQSAAPSSPIVQYISGAGPSYFGGLVLAIQKYVPVSVPSAPQDPVATAGDKQATVTWVAPVSNGGATITSYTITSTPATNTNTVNDGPPPSTSTVMTGLSNSVSYTFTITATNSAGAGPGATTNSVTPQGNYFANLPENPSLIDLLSGLGIYFRGTQEYGIAQDQTTDFDGVVRLISETTSTNPTITRIIQTSRNLAQEVNNTANTIGKFVNYGRTTLETTGETDSFIPSQRGIVRTFNTTISTIDNIGRGTNNLRLGQDLTNVVDTIFDKDSIVRSALDPIVIMADQLSALTTHIHSAIFGPEIDLVNDTINRTQILARNISTQSLSADTTGKILSTNKPITENTPFIVDTTNKSAFRIIHLANENIYTMPGGLPAQPIGLFQPGFIRPGGTPSYAYFIADGPTINHAFFAAIAQATSTIDAPLIRAFGKPILSVMFFVADQLFAQKNASLLKFVNPSDNVFSLFSNPTIIYGIGKTISETINITDQELTGYFRRIPQELITMIDTLSRAVISLRAISETINITDQTTRLILYYRIVLPLTISSLDTLLRLTTGARTITDGTIGIVDSIIAGKYKYINVGDNLPRLVDLGVKNALNMMEYLPIIGDLVTFTRQRTRYIRFRDWLPGTLDSLSRMLIHGIVVIQYANNQGNESIGPTELGPNIIDAPSFIVTH